jgi:hypothetical protein
MYIRDKFKYEQTSTRPFVATPTPFDYLTMPRGAEEEEVVGCTLQLGCDYITAQQHENLVKRQLRKDLAAALTMPVERFSEPTLERGSVLAKFNVVPGPGPSARELAQQVVGQAQSSASPLRSLPLGRMVVWNM